MARLSSSNLMDNEILKTADLNDGFNAQISNISKALISLLDTSNDFIVGGKTIVEPHSNRTGDWGINIAPLMGICASTGQIFLETESLVNAASISQPSEFDRTDVVEVRGVYITTKEQQRAFMDFDNENKTLGYVDTEKQIKTEVRILANTIESVSAPNHSNGWVKVAEIFVPSNATKITDCEIYNITADIADLNNDYWTNEKDATYNVRYISDVNARQRVEHEENGKHKENVIHLTQLDTGLGNDQVNGNNVPTGGENIVFDEKISASKTIYETLQIFADKLNKLYSEYLKDGKYSFNGEIVVKGDDKKQQDKPPFKLGLNENGSVYFKLGNTVLFYLLPDGKLRTNINYVPENEYDLVTKKTTDKIDSDLQQVEKRVKQLETDVDQSEYTNNLLGRYSISSLEVVAASTKNTGLRDLQSVDGISCNENDIVLVMAQDNPIENGLYKVSSDNWMRVESFASPEKLIGKMFVIKNGSINKNKIFYCPKEHFINSAEFGSDNISFTEYMGAIAPLKNKTVVRDEKGHVKGTASESENDCVVRNEFSTKNGAVAKMMLDFIYPVGSVYWTSKNENPRDIFGIGVWKKIEGCFVFASDTKHLNSTSGGNETISLSTDQMPKHSHSFTGTNADTGENSVGHVHGYTPSGSIGIRANPSFSGNAAEGRLYGMDVDTRPSGVFSTETGYSGWNPDGKSGDDAIVVKFDMTPSGSITGGEYLFYGAYDNTGGQSANHTHNYTPAGSIGESGKTSAINIMPPYTVKNCWERVE